MKKSMIFGATALTLALQSTAALASDTLNCASGPNGVDAGPAARSNAEQKLNVAVLINIDNGQALLCVNERNASRSTMIGVISGAENSEKLVGMDYRVQDGKLYAVGSMGGIYTVDTTTAALTPVNKLTVQLEGTLFGVDFNPAADRLRIVSNTGQNLRHNVNMGGLTIADSGLNTGAGTPPPPVTGIVSGAYTNNDVLQAATSTTLLVINGTSDTVALQSPANSGIIAATGSLGVNTSGPVGFDIYNTLRDGVATTNRALLSATVEGTDNAVLYSVDVLTGAASKASNFAKGVKVVDIAIPLNQKTED